MPNIDVIFNDGIRQDEDIRALPPSALRQARNCIIDSTGAIEKRPGSDSLSLKIQTPPPDTANTVTSIRRIAGYNQELLVFTAEDGVFKRAGVANVMVQSPSNMISRCMATRESVVERPIPFDCGYDVGFTANYTIYAYAPGRIGTDNTHIYATVVDNPTGARIINDVRVSTTANVSDPRVMITGNTALVFYGDSTAGGSIYAVKLDLASPWAFGSESIVAAKVGSAHLWDASEISGDTGNVALVRQTNSGTREITVSTVDISTLLPSSFDTVTRPSGSMLGLGITGTSGENLWFAVSMQEASGNANCYAYMYTMNPLALSSIQGTDVAATINNTSGEVVKVGVGRYTSNTVVITTTGPQSGQLQSKWSTIDTSNTVVSGWNVLNHKFVSRPKVVNNSAYAVLQGSTFFNIGGNSALGYYDTAYHMVDLHVAQDSSGLDSRVPIEVARLGPRITQQTINHKKLTNLYAVGNTALSLGSIRSSGQVSGGRTGMAKLEFDFGLRLQYQSVSLGGLMHVTSGVPLVYDAGRFSEEGFNFSPTISTSIASAGGSITNGTYRYAAIWEWFDNQGLVHRSAPVFSGNVVVTVGPSASVNVTSNGLALTTKTTFSGPTNPPYLAVYRTLELGANPSSVYYRTFGDSPASNAYTGEPGTSVSFVDTNIDSSISSRPTLYTTGGVLENQCPPASQVITVHKNRIWMVGDDGTTLWFSKESTPGEAPGFNDILTYPFPEWGRVYGLASLDDKLLVLKKQTLFVIAGDGPSDTGTGYDYSRPFQVLTDVGCDNWRSVVTTPMGVFYANQKKGIFLCTRNLEVQWIGHRVADLFLANPVVTSAFVHQNHRWVLFTCLPTEDSATGITLVYDLDHDRWTSWDYSTAAGVSRGATSACLFNGSYTVALSGPVVLSWNENTFRDNAQAIPFVVELGWQVNGVNGDMVVRRAQLHGEAVSQHGLSVEFSRDFSGSYDSPAKVITEQAVANMALERIRFGPKYQRCQSFSMKITEVASSLGNGKGCRLHGVTFDAEPLQGPWPRLSSGQQA